MLEGFWSFLAYFGGEIGFSSNYLHSKALYILGTKLYRIADINTCYFCVEPTTDFVHKYKGTLLLHNKQIKS